jgi:hypothetical protein
MHHNLLNEKEFFKPYNPQKRFVFFAILAFIESLLIYMLSYYVSNLNTVEISVARVLVITVMLSPLVLGMLMLLGSDKMLAVSTSKKVTGLLLFNATYYITMIGITLYDNIKVGNNQDSLLEIASYLALFFIVSLALTLAIAIPISNKRKRALK